MRTTGRRGAAVDTLILHYTGMPSAAAALERLCDPAAAVSAHYLIDEDGSTTRLVPEERRAWHAGASIWAGRARLNDCSIGIELVNPGHEWGYRPFTEAQYASCIALCRAILERWPIPPHRVLAHSDVAPERKQDPGELFDWARLGAAGIGLWPPSGAGRPARPWSTAGRPRPLRLRRDAKRPPRRRHAPGDRGPATTFPADPRRRRARPGNARPPGRPPDAVAGA